MEVARTLSQVFRDAGYTAAPLPPNKDMMLMFEKQGGTGDMLLYGDWSGKPPWSRVKLNIKSRDPQNHLVECNVYRVLDRGDPRFEEETRTRINRKAYQELLNLAKAKLDATPASPPGT